MNDNFSDLKIENHDAPGQMTGYFYEALAALLILLVKKEPDSKISLEKVDDVLFDSGLSAIEAIQVKHHKPGNGNLSDHSVDFWRSINSWCDSIKSSRIEANTVFVLFSTGCAPDNSIASKLRQDKSRDTESALFDLCSICDNNPAESIACFCANFLSLSEDQRKLLINGMTILDSMAPIDTIDAEIKKEISSAVLPQYSDEIYQALLGWWFSAVIKALSIPEYNVITYLSLQKKIAELVAAHSTWSLPINVDFRSYPTTAETAEMTSKKPNFIKQLQFISLSDEQIKMYMRDYLHATTQISKWLRDELVLPDDIASYKDSLADEWKRHFDRMTNDLVCKPVGPTEPEKQEAGRRLLYNIDELNLPIRPGVDYPFIMRGTFQILSNNKKVGWHVDYLQLLTKTLNGDKNGS